MGGPCEVCGGETRKGVPGTCCYEHARRICFDCFNALHIDFYLDRVDDPCNLDWSKIGPSIEDVLKGLRDIEADLR